MSEKLEKLIAELDALTLMEAAELSKMLQEKWGVSAAAPMMMGAMTA
ncbi:MAG TPA: 50S ribosomal protein L7/L12, partial [Anaerolineae bacterium]|nr:50S ribosomal protein L7/L12 [Anaerolineae bacterium]